MVSRRNFFSIIVMMAVLLFMFQFSQVIKENDSDYDINAYALEDTMPNAPQWKEDNTEQGNAVQISTVYGDYVVFCGNEEDAVYSVVKEWCVYTKRGLRVYGNPGEYVAVEGNLPEAFLIDSSQIDLAEYLPEFARLTDLGVTLVFCNLPSAMAIGQEPQLCSLLGIQQVFLEQIEVEGIHLFSDFLLGGEMWYLTKKEEEKKNQDLDLNVPWYYTAGGTKTYMVGILEKLLEDEDAKNEYFPPLIWRNSYGQSKVFVVNGAYLSDITGLGILDAIMYEADSYVVYPIVNAQNVIVTNYPEFAKENDGKMVELYSRKMDAVQRDICWPDLATLVERNKLKLTCLFAPQYNYLDGIEPSGETVPFYLQQLKEAGAEAGFSLTYGEGITLAQKLERDEQFYDSLANRYVYTAAFVDMEDLGPLGKELKNTKLLGNIRTVACDYHRSNPVVSWYEIPEGSEGADGRFVTLQSVTSDIKTHTYSNDLFMRSIETALGYSNVRIDMYDMLWPQSEDDQWENMYDNIASNLNTYWKVFSVFSQTTLTESDKRVRAFLNLDYKDMREGDCIYLQTTGAQESWFILRTHGEEILSISGADYQKIEKDAYLLHVTKEQVEICMGKTRGSLRYTYP